MDKLAWVTLPLLLALAAMALAWARGRLPSRLALNVASSLLLLVYLGVTAGLGIFWVANQHLPVFDWHYLFGYATVALLLVHLGFNFHVVWRTLTQRRAAAAPRTESPRGPPAPTQPRRRVPVLGLAGALLLAAGAYALGLRHGRTELRVQAAAGPGTAAGPAPPATAATAAAATPAGATALAVVEAFHEFSAHSRAGLFRRAPGADWGTAPPPFKSWPGLPALALPPPQLRAPPARAAGAPITLPALATLLFAAAGVNLRRGGIAFRTAPSSGALFASELYLRVHRVAGLAPGLYHYDGGAHRLVRLPGAAEPPAGTPAPEVELVASAVFRRSGHKYRDRTYRYVLGDLGHLLENLRVAALALGIAAQPWRHFDESASAALFGLDEAEEGVLARWALGAGAAQAVAAAEAQAWQAAPLAEGGALGITDAVHRATSLRPVPGAPAALPVPVPAAATAPPAVAGGDGAWALPAPAPAAMPPLERIARRRSERRYARTPLSAAALSALLDAALRRTGPVLSEAVRVHVLAAAVDGLAAAAWRYDPRGHRLLLSATPDDLRPRARSAALSQDVVGDAAAVIVLALERAAFAADTAGAARGWRHAFLEAGMVGERLYLEAAALGLGCCGVGAFHDDEAAALLGVDPAREWVLHFVAIGRLDSA
ncbi:MAG: SagB family peptide dehydrogenase [Burkholderiaceae bacterium]|nr:SagB family peptide dehydrogenase [Burkholderiaceae bacterium]